MTQDARETTVDEPQVAGEETAEPTTDEVECTTKPEAVDESQDTISEAAESDYETKAVAEEEFEEDQWPAQPTDEEDLNVENGSDSKDEQTLNDEETPEQTDGPEKSDDPVGCAPHTEPTDEEDISEPNDTEEEHESTDDTVAGDDVETPEQTDQEAEPAEEEQPVTIESVVEAILFASDEPLTDGRLAKIVETTSGQVRKCIEALNAKYETNCNAFRIEQIAGGYQMLTLSTYNQWLGKMLRVRGDTKLSPAAMETLAIIAYKQPVIRVDIEAIRGVAVGEVIRSLMYKGLVKIVGRAEILGRPMLYGTTKKFLEVFGLNSLKDLPKAEELKNPD